MLVIDTKSQSVYEKEIDCPKERLKEIQKIVGGYICVAFDMELSDGSFISAYVNDEGLFNDTLDFFKIDGVRQPFAGNGVIVGFNPETGESVSVNEFAKEVIPKISYARRFPAE